MGQPQRHSCTQATFTTDGRCIMDTEDYINFMIHSFAQQMTYYISQTDPKALLRFDQDRFFSSFSYVNDEGVHVGLKPSPYRPGWSGCDTEIGTMYKERLNELSEEALRALHNSDLISQAPYANDTLLSAKIQWEEQLRETSMSIPICAVTEAVSPWNVIGGRPVARKGLSCIPLLISR
jgi:hypothetical protein